jgi:hypothetical protein
VRRGAEVAKIFCHLSTTITSYRNINGFGTYNNRLCNDGTSVLSWSKPSACPAIYPHASLRRRRSLLIQGV